MNDRMKVRMNERMNDVCMSYYLNGNKHIKEKKNVATMFEIIATTVDNVAKYSSTTFFWQNCGLLYVHTVYNAQEMPY
jgi:hypothetical protein